MDLSEKTGIRRQVLNEIAALAVKWGVERVILFGSRARGDYKPRSDIDLAFWGGNGAEFIWEVDETTSTLLKFDIVNLLTPITHELRTSIERDGIILYEKG